jgi:hypothetical protein
VIVHCLHVSLMTSGILRLGLDPRYCRRNTRVLYYSDGTVPGLWRV